MFCEFGCGQAGLHQLRNGKLACLPRVQSCPSVRAKLSEKAKARPKRIQTQEEKDKRAASLRGLKRTLEQCARFSEAQKEVWKNNPRVPWNKGLKGTQVAWNKGMRKRAPVSECKDDPFASFQRYRNRVTTRTQRVYELHKEEINPHNHPRGRCGVDGAWQLDHIISVKEGFEKQIPVDVISAKENLQMLPWLENIRKYG